MNEVYLWAALALVHTLGAWMTHALVEQYAWFKKLRKVDHLDAVLCFLVWELIALAVIFERKE